MTYRWDFFFSLLLLSHRDLYSRSRWLAYVDSTIACVGASLAGRAFLVSGSRQKKIHSWGTWEDLIADLKGSHGSANQGQHRAMENAIVIGEDGCGIVAW